MRTGQELGVSPPLWRGQTPQLPEEWKREDPVIFQEGQGHEDCIPFNNFKNRERWERGIVSGM